MEATATALRRLSLLSSHFRTHCFSTQVAFNCSFSSSTNGENHENGCVFCLIVRGEAPALKVYEDDVCLCILDANPLCFGHSLVIPKSHFPSLQETPPSVVAAMSSKVPLISSAVMKATGCDSFNLLVNNGAASGQVIFHNVHTYKREPWSNDFEPWKQPLMLILGQAVYINPSLDPAYCMNAGCFMLRATLYNAHTCDDLSFAWQDQTHIHIIPRKASDCLWTSESFSRCPLESDEALKLADGIRENLSFSNYFEDSKEQGSSVIVN